jgi:hypothetical protein
VLLANTYRQAGPSGIAKKKPAAAKKTTRAVSMGVQAGGVEKKSGAAAKRPRAKAVAAAAAAAAAGAAEEVQEAGSMGSMVPQEVRVWAWGGRCRTQQGILGP